MHTGLCAVRHQLGELSDIAAEPLSGSITLVFFIDPAVFALARLPAEVGDIQKLVGN